VIFATASHILERLHLIHLGNTAFVSNSLPFVLEAAGATLDPSYTDYQVDLWSIMHGLNRCKTDLPTLRGPRVRLFYYCNVEIDQALNVVSHQKPAPPSGATFGEYSHFLHEAVKRVTANAQAPERAIQYEPLATLSAGYDSAASALVAARAGCRRAVTFRTGFRYFEDGREVDDSGAAIARRLGLEVREHPLAPCSEEYGPELACGADACEAQLPALAPELGRSMLVTGVPGDRVWNRSNPDRKPEWARADPSWTGLGEFRLRVGFTHVPVPSFAAMSVLQIRAISQSKEMAPWTLGTAYDRPIARRLLEEAGIPREWFGQTKQGAFLTLGVTRGRPSRFASFEAFHHEHRLRGLDALKAEARYRVREVGRLWTRAANRYGIPLPFPGLTQWDVAIPGRPSLVVQWGCAVVQARYRAALETGSRTDDVPAALARP
jgi:hypothetical protein